MSATDRSSELSFTDSGGESIDPAWTINEIIRRSPAADSVLRRHGFDSCCGGSLTLAEAAGRHGVDLGALLSALRTEAFASS